MRLLVLLSFLLLSCFGYSQNSSFLKFETKQIDLGIVTKGAVIDTVFNFTNASEDPIEIDIIDACECTTLDWTRGSIDPGSQGKIMVRFDSAKKDIEEEISIDITLMNDDPITGGPVMDAVYYTYTFKE